MTFLQLITSEAIAGTPCFESIILVCIIKIGHIEITRVYIRIIEQEEGSFIIIITKAFRCEVALN